MTPFCSVEGRAYPLGRNNVDTDTIIAAQHLKTISRTGLGRHAFEALRGEPGNVFDDPVYSEAPILIAGDNFGCGSSREHAAWALADMGVRAIVASSFSDIFSANAYKNGILAVALERRAVNRLMELAREEVIAVDLETMKVTAPGACFSFELDPFRRQCLLGGLDEIAVILLSEPAIRAYEERIGCVPPRRATS